MFLSARFIWRGVQYGESFLKLNNIKIEIAVHGPTNPEQT